VAVQAICAYLVAACRRTRASLSLGQPLVCTPAVTLLRRLRQDLKDQVCNSAYQLLPRVGAGLSEASFLQELGQRTAPSHRGGQIPEGRGRWFFASALWGFAFSVWSCRDDYERLCSKCLLALTCLPWWAGIPRLIYTIRRRTYGLDSADALFDPTSTICSETTWPMRGTPVTAFRINRRFLVEII